jgi:hypothetical protein
MRDGPVSCAVKSRNPTDRLGAFIDTGPSSYRADVISRSEEVGRVGPRRSIGQLIRNTSGGSGSRVKCPDKRRSSLFRSNHRWSTCLSPCSALCLSVTSQVRRSLPPSHILTSHLEFSVHNMSRFCSLQPRHLSQTERISRRMLGGLEWCLRHPWPTLIPMLRTVLSRQSRLIHSMPRDSASIKGTWYVEKMLYSFWLLTLSRLK